MADPVEALADLAESRKERNADVVSRMLRKSSRRSLRRRDVLKHAGKFES